MPCLPFLRWREGNEYGFGSEGDAVWFLYSGLFESGLGLMDGDGDEGGEGDGKGGGLWIGGVGLFLF